MARIEWPDGKRFAFSAFDDTDSATLENVGPVYALLDDLGFRTTKSVWPITGDPNKGTFPGKTCEDDDYRQWALGLQAKGFEIGWHNSTWHGVPRETIVAAFERFAEVFGDYPKTGANHTLDEGIYFGNERVSGIHSLLYDLLTLFRRHNKYFGHVEGSKFFWGDLCKDKMKYYRNLVFPEINTLKACPQMPYHDPDRPYVNYWFASSEGAEVNSYCRCLSEENQDRLEEEGGACIMYTHFTNGFFHEGRLDKRFRSLMEKLAARNGWFVPVRTLLDYILERRGHLEITRRERAKLERKWLLHKLKVGRT